MTRLPSHCFAGMNLGDRGTVARIMATIRMILSLPHEEEKSQNPVHMKTKKLSLVLILLLTYFSASPTSQAVTPPPDGGYPGGNTAEGQNALLSLTAGTYNTAVGWFSLKATSPATSTRPSAPGRFLPTPQTTIRLLARRHFKQHQVAFPIPPPERSRCLPTPSAFSTLAAGPLHF